MNYASLSDDPVAVHILLTEYGRRRLNPAVPDDDWQAWIEQSARLARLEMEFLESERHKVVSLAAEAPSDSAGFLGWYQAQKDEGPGQHDPLFEWLAEDADYEQMRWFIKQETVGEAGFDDLLALTQLRMPRDPKLEMARNYWDEMGRGKAPAMHGPMLKGLAEELEVADAPVEELCWEVLSLGNILIGLAINRRYAYHAIGSLGAVELTSPTRTVMVAKGLERLGVSRQGVHYYRLHSTVDISHSQEWKKHVIAQLVDEDPARARYIAEGLLMRLNAGARCFDRYREYFGLGGARVQIG